MIQCCNPLMAKNIVFCFYGKTCKDEWIWIMEYRKLIKCECDSWARAASQCWVGGTFLTLTNDLASFLLEHVGDIQHKNNGSHIILYESLFLTKFLHDNQYFPNVMEARMHFNVGALELFCLWAHTTHNYKLNGSH